MRTGDVANINQRKNKKLDIDEEPKGSFFNIKNTCTARVNAGKGVKNGRIYSH